MLTPSSKAASASAAPVWRSTASQTFSMPNIWFRIAVGVESLKVQHSMHFLICKSFWQALNVAPEHQGKATTPSSIIRIPRLPIAFQSWQALNKSPVTDTRRSSPRIQARDCCSQNWDNSSVCKFRKDVWQSSTTPQSLGYVLNLATKTSLLLPLITPRGTSVLLTLIANCFCSFYGGLLILKLTGLVHKDYL